MGVDFGYTSCHDGEIFKMLHCTWCGRHLGNYEWVDGIEHCDIDEWSFCPFCGHSLEND